MRTRLLLALALALAPATSTAQRLRRASEAARTGRSDRPRDRDSRGSSSASSPSSSSRSSSRSGRWLFRRRPFLPFPYAWGCVGYEPPAAVDGERAGLVAFTATLDGGYVFDGVARGGAGLRLMTAGLEFEIRYSAYAEDDGGETFWVALGRYRAGVALIDVARARARLFAGVIHWADHDGSVFGGEAGVGVDLFVSAPFVASVDLSLGAFGRAVLAGGRASFGVMAGPVEIQLGWQHESIIPTLSGPPVNLSGPFAGVRLWR